MSKYLSPIKWIHDPLKIDERNALEAVQEALNRYAERLKAYNEAREKFNDLFTAIEEAKESDRRAAYYAAKNGKPAPERKTPAAEQAHKDQEIFLVELAKMANESANAVMRVASANRDEWAQAASDAALADYAKAEQALAVLEAAMTSLDRSRGQLSWARQRGPLRESRSSGGMQTSDLESVRRWVSGMEPKPLPTPEEIAAKKAAEEKRRSEKAQYRKLAVRASRGQWNPL